MPDLVLSYESAASVWPISIVVGSVFVAISVRCHHAVPSERWDRVIVDLAQRERIDVIVSDARSDLDHGVGVIIDHVSAAGCGGFARIRTSRIAYLPLGLGVDIVV
jgi:hypothetical protein